MEEENKTLFDISFTLATCYVTITLFVSIIGVCGNTFIIYVMRKEKKMNADAKKFIINMAVADLCVTGIALPMCMAGAFLGMDFLQDGLWFCVVIASLCLTACVCVFLNVVGLTVNRWLLMCHETIYRRIYNKVSTIVFCAATWVIGFCAELPNFFGYGGHYFDEKSHQCIWDRTAHRGYTLFVAFGLIVSPLLLLAYCNFAMFRKIWAVKKNIVKASAESQSTFKSSLKSSQILLTMFIVFIVCWTPYVIVLVADTENKFAFEVHLFTTLLAHSHSSSSCLIYLGYKKNFRENLRRLFQRSKVHPSTVSQQTNGNKRTNLNTQPTKTSMVSSAANDKGMFRVNLTNYTEGNVALQMDKSLKIVHAYPQTHLLVTENY